MDSNDEFWARQSGVDVDTYRRQKAFRERISKEAEKYEGTPVEQWPDIEFHWDLSRASQKFSLDACCHKSFDQYYPDGFCLGWVDLPEFDKYLHRQSQRGMHELWDVGISSKLAFLIVYLSEGHPISPPSVICAEEPMPTETGKILINGGNHRYAVAKAKQEPEIPIHVDPKFKEELSGIVDVRWS